MIATLLRRIRRTERPPTPFLSTMRDARCDAVSQSRAAIHATAQLKRRNLMEHELLRKRREAGS